MPRHDLPSHGEADPTSPATFAQLAAALPIIAELQWTRLLTEMLSSRAHVLITAQTMAQFLESFIASLSPQAPLAEPMVIELRSIIIKMIGLVSQRILAHEPNSSREMLLEDLTRIAAALFGPLGQGIWGNLAIPVSPARDRVMCRDTPSAITRLERLLGRPGSITRLPPADAQALVCLKGWNFAEELRRARRSRDLTQAQLAAEFWTWGIKQVAVSAWETGQYSPSPAFEAAILLIAHRFDRPQLFTAYLETREMRVDDHPRAQSRDVDFHAFVVPHLGSIDQICTSALSTDGINPHTRACINQAFGCVFAAASLPSGKNVPARQRGLGRQTFSVLSALDPEIITSTERLLSSRSAGSAAIFRTLAQLTRPCGPIWRAAANLGRLVENEPWIARDWPRRPAVDSPGAPCRSAAERIRAQLYTVHERYLELARSGRCRQPSKMVRRRLESAVKNHPNTLVAMFSLLRSIPLRGRLITDDQRTGAMVASILTASLLRPLSSGNHEWTRWRIKKHGNNRYDFLVLADDGTEVRRQPIPRELVRFVAPYDSLRTEAGEDSKPYYLNSDGDELSAASLGYRIKRIVRLHRPHLFPRGLNISDTAAMVSTDLAIRWGVTAGAQLAAFICRKSVQAVRTELVLLKGLPERSVKLERAQWHISLARAFKEAGALALKKPRQSNRKRRSRSEIDRWRAVRRR